MSAAADARKAAKRVILVSHGFQTNYERGFSNGLASHPQYHVTLIGSDRSDCAGLSAAVEFINLRGSQEENRPRWAKALNLLSYHLRLMLFVLLHRNAVVHVIGLIEPVVPLGIWQGVFFRWFSRRFVLTVHNLLPHGDHSETARKNFRRAYRNPHLLVVHTARMRERLAEEFGVDRNRVVVMTHGVEPIVTPVTNVSAAHPSARPVLLFFGIVQPYKGLDVLLHALEQVEADFQLRIVGRCESKPLREQLAKQIETHPRASGISWRCEYVSETEVPGIFTEADVLIMPYRHIDQSGVLFQALRHGTPVVATRVGSLAEYIDATNGELCEPDNPDDLAHAIGRALARVHQFDRQAIRDAARAYEWPATVTALDRAYA